MKKLYRILAVAALVVMAFQCGKPVLPGNGGNGGDGGNGGNGGGGDEGPGIVTENFSLSLEKKTIATWHARRFDIPVQSDSDDWSIESDAPWCVIERKDRFMMTFSITQFRPEDEYGTPVYAEPRHCTLTVKSPKGAESKYEVYQESLTRITTDLFGAPLLLASSGETVTVRVYTNCYGWTATKDRDASWISLDTKGDGVLEITSSPREGSTPRSATVRIVSSLNPEVVESISVSDKPDDMSGENYEYGEGSDWD